MNKKRVLIIRLSSLGDVIFNLPLASVLKKAGYYVAWITSEKGIDVIKNNPLVDDAILAPLKKWKKQPFKENLKEYLSLIKYIRSQKFDIAIDTQLLLKSFIWNFFSGAKRRIVSIGAREFSMLGGNDFIEPLSTDSESHAIENYLKYAKHLNLDTKNYDVDLPPTSPETKSKIDDVLSNLDSKPLVVICPATTWAPKHWNKEHWKELITRLGNNYNLVFTGAPTDVELISYISEDKHLNLAGKTNIPDLIEIFRRADLVVSLDSGSTHLAWATQHPKIISIFCCTPTSLYAPIGDETKYASLTGKIDCQPCHKRICPLKENKNCCTMNPGVDEVYNKILEFLPIRI